MRAGGGDHRGAGHPRLLADNCYATSLLAETGVRFYAGVRLVTREGFGLGSLCVLGTEPRTVSEVEMTGLSDLADMVMAQIEMQHAFGRIDPLSGLPNRTQFLDDLEDLGRDAPGERRYAVLLDLARNDQLNNGLRVMGPSFVDDMVQDAARSLRAALAPDERPTMSLQRSLRSCPRLSRSGTHIWRCSTRCWRQPRMLPSFGSP